ncbi:NAD(P)/FAD-dependent oxidoreductase [Roseiarcaceae bacterium H3SJ34-1]|uniref:flavin-containing monooxygenase n=1 Tax=Terripilifer ovatus TaxID=3032367 RepID=UPI003AB97E19|nr:NAD(P)/FAD-dependent oxidoreductase [Roseiarcaceae bacterium H3SJ34-1]
MTNKSPAAKSQGALAAAGEVEHFDVLIVGAGISGIGGAYHLKTQCPGMRFVILESLEGYGGTWLTHKYPGTRSDSDLYTFGYRFKPWTGKPIATREEILRYMGEVISENDLTPHIRYRHKISSARWSSQSNAWTITAYDAATEETFQISAGFLWMCHGYYRHSEGYTPQWLDMDKYQGRVVHPQDWPTDLEYESKKVVVIGSGATAATIIPAIAPACAHVTMLQRSPTYFRTGRNANELADQLRPLGIDERWIHEIVRRKILFDQDAFIRRCTDEPEVVKRELLNGARAYLGADFDVDTHFAPKYRPFQQRIAFIPDGDLFQSISSSKASVVTDEIDRFTEKGILLKSGEHLDADIIITATGFNLSPLGDIEFVIDDKPLQFSETVTYRGLMFTGVPNMVWVFGYFRASWTLRADLVSDFVCALLNHMKNKRTAKVSVALPPEDQHMALQPWIDPQEFNPGYLMRGLHLLPKSGAKPEWRHSQDYWREKDQLPKTDFDDPAFVYE